MGIISEQFILYGSVVLLSLLIIALYVVLQRRASRKTFNKLEQAKLEGLHEPVSLHPVIDPNSCIKTGACISACPEKDILGIYKGKAMAINTSLCIGHGACFHACPTQAITLCIGTEQRGVDLPHVKPTFETNVPGLYIAGELGGMGLIRNAVAQGKQAVENMINAPKEGKDAEFDLVIVGAGPAGISASLAAKKHRLHAVTLDQDTLGGTVYTFPRSKIVMTAPMDLPLFGKVKLTETSKTVLLDLWKTVVEKHAVNLKERTRVVEIRRKNGCFETITSDGQVYSSRLVLLAIGRRGTPRKLGIPGEETEKVTYRLLEPEQITGQHIIVVGGGDSAVEAALALEAQNEVLLSYRGDAFKRLKPKNKELVTGAIDAGRIDMRLSSNLVSIGTKETILKDAAGEHAIPADRVFIFAGGELPTEFLKRAGIQITTRFGEAVLKH